MQGSALKLTFDLAEEWEEIQEEQLANRKRLAHVTEQRAQLQHEQGPLQKQWAHYEILFRSRSKRLANASALLTDGRATTFAQLRSKLTSKCGLLVC